MATLSLDKRICSTFCLLLCFTVSIIVSEQVKGDEYQVTPISLLDLTQDLRLLHNGMQADYYISNYEADADTARQVCQNLTDLTGKHFHLLMLETGVEFEELQSYLDSMEISGVWTAGEKSFDDQGDISLFWSTNEGPRLMTFKNFRQGLAARKRREAITGSEEVELGPGNSITSVLYPWLNIENSKSGEKCRNGKFTVQECEPVKCNVTMPECETITPPCTVRNQTDCSITRPPCTAKCENCTVLPPVCRVTSKQCTVTTEPCQTIRAPCNVSTPDCTTTRPPCTTIQPPCDVVTPPPCTTPQPKCIPTFEKDNCTTTTFPCKTNRKNETNCPEPKTVCEPSYKCPPPEVCQSPAIICPPPLIYCEPEQTVCPEPQVFCPKPVIYCPQPQVDCPLPEVECDPPQVQCDPPVVNCPGIVTSCPAPQLECPPPDVRCPDPIVNCTTPEPCEPPTTPPPCDPTTTTSTTERPCNGCGCILMSKKHNFKWDIETCRTKYHFICEG